MKKMIINSTIKTLNNLAERSVGIACYILIHQPKEPKCLQKPTK